MVTSSPEASKSWESKRDGVVVPRIAVINVGFSKATRAVMWRVLLVFPCGEALLRHAADLRTASPSIGAAPQVLMVATLIRCWTQNLTLISCMPGMEATH